MNRKTLRCLIGTTLRALQVSQRSKRDDLLADWAILLVGYDGKVTSDCPQAGEDLEDSSV